MSFKLLKSSTRGAYNRFSGLPYPAISIVKKYIFFNKMAIDSFGLEDPDNNGGVMIFLDEENLLLGFKPVVKRTVGSYSITCYQKWSRYRINMNKYLLACCESKVGNVFRLTKEQTEHGPLFVVDLSQPE